MKQKPSKKTFSGWILEHVRPHIGWANDPDGLDQDEKPQGNIIDEWKHKIKEHVIFGVKFTWRF